MLYEEDKIIHKENIESQTKIDNSYLEKINNQNILPYFGDWVNNVNKLKNQFTNAEPFENIIIPNFLDKDYAELLYKQFPESCENWHKYENPLEVKYAFDNIHQLPDELKNLFYYLSSKQMTQVFSLLTDIETLEYDPFLHGSGLHAHPKHGRLNLHLDYEKHPHSGKERRINVILYLSKDWNSSWNGATELWDKNLEKCVVSSPVVFNTAIIFKTNDISYHGLPNKITCPENMLRKSFAYYYVSSLNSKKKEEEYRKKATYVSRPQDKHDARIEKLFKIRSLRRITKEDLKEIIPEWSIYT